MANGMIFCGITQAQYDRVRTQVAPDNRRAPGLRFHAAGQGQDGFCVVEVWDSQEALDTFFAEKLGAALHETNITAQPTFFQVTNTMDA
jgi:hypothetical protein